MRFARFAAPVLAALAALAGVAGLSVRPATAAPGRTATVHRTDSARAPGTVPNARSGWLWRTQSGCPPRFAPRASGRLRPVSRLGHRPAARARESSAPGGQAA